MKTFKLLARVLPGAVIILILVVAASCKGMDNPVSQVPGQGEAGHFLTVGDGTKIFISEHKPACEPGRSIYIISGITGINHKSEQQIIDLLCNNSNRVVVVHPRGTGYSEGARGDTSPESIISDYCEIISGDSSFYSADHKIVLFGHSMSCAFALEVALRLRRTDGLILVNPPYRLKPAEGMSPDFKDYLRYAGYYLFAPHTPVVNMAGDPSLITDETDRLESEQRNIDPLLVKYFSMRCMATSRKIMKSMVKRARRADYPLLLLYGENDKIVDKSGCDEIFSAWNCQRKSYVIIKGGTHGKSTVIKGAGIIAGWLEGI